jgi:hypothetical protein
MPKFRSASRSRSGVTSNASHGLLPVELNGMAGHPVIPQGIAAGTDAGDHRRPPPLAAGRGRHLAGGGPDARRGRRRPHLRADRQPPRRRRLLCRHGPGRPGTAGPVRGCGRAAGRPPRTATSAEPPRPTTPHRARGVARPLGQLLEVERETVLLRHDLASRFQQPEAAPDAIPTLPSLRPPPGRTCTGPWLVATAPCPRRVAGTGHLIGRRAGRSHPSAAAPPGGPTSPTGPPAR